MNKKRHKIEQYYSIRAQVAGGNTILIDTNGWDGTSVEKLVTLINEQTGTQWEKVRVLKYIQCIDKQKATGPKIVSQRRSLLKVTRDNSNFSLCTKVDANMRRNGVIPANISAFFGDKVK